MSDLARLAAHLDGLGRVLLGYSGGVDSALLAVVSARLPGNDRFLAVLGVSPSLAAFQYRQAMELASRFSIPLLELDTRELEDPRYSANPTNRCYFCKTELWSRLHALAADRGYDSIIDGTNADDLGEHRPGLAAANERKVRSPLAELGWSKTQVRAAARLLELPIWDAPSSPCLSSRIRYGVAVTPARLRQVEAAEEWLRGIGITGDLRVRHLGEAARIEVDPIHFNLLLERWQEVEQTLLDLGFGAVERDPRGYRRGGLLALARTG
jgi:uncharacterized protein